MQQVIVTGGAGFIGSNFIRFALDRHADWEILNFDKLTYAGNLANLQDVADHPRYRFIQGDIADSVAVAKVFAVGADLVINFAAESHVDRSITSGDEFLRTNVLGTNVLLDAAQTTGVKKFLHISTDEVYGDLPAGSFASETDPLRASSPYAASKAASDLLVLAHARTHQLPILITRCTNNYGPFQFPEKMLPLFTTNLLQGKKVPVYGDGRQIRDWLHVEDHCRAIDLVVSDGTVGEIYNVGANHDPERTNLAITELILRELGLDQSMIEHVTDRPGHDRRYAVATDKIETLGWQPQVPIEDGIRATVRWYKKHPEWWQPLVHPAS